MSNFPKLFEDHYEYLLREVLEAIDDAVLVFGHDHKLIYANEAAEDVFGVNKKGLVGESLTRLIPKGKAARFNAIIAELNASGHQEIQLQGKREFIGVRAKDHFFYAEGRLAKFKKESAYIVVLRDITWRKVMEQELQTTLDRLKKVGRKVAYRVEHPRILDEFPVD